MQPKIQSPWTFIFSNPSCSHNLADDLQELAKTNVSTQSISDGNSSEAEDIGRLSRVREGRTHHDKWKFTQMGTEQWWGIVLWPIGGLNKEPVMLE